MDAKIPGTGRFGLMNQRGRREVYSDQDRYFQKLKRKQNAKKVLRNLHAGGEEQRYKAIEVVASSYPVSSLCKLFKVSRSGYYVYLKRKRDKEAASLISQVYVRYEGKYGYRQIQLFLWHDNGVWMNHKKVLRLMQKLGIQAKTHRKRRVNVTYQAGERVVENLLNRNFTAEKPN
ncbi:transposase [Paenibacillus albidus]|uniref:IS3 family transposase n=1 Tax=Paenibacillus albidus TaxID=2041023 RepID=UPI001BEA4AFC|nr:IS3 family transposase [Paenibacillus albidus]MBT2293488.1 transposase [Paenibacillus albidus]